MALSINWRRLRDDIEAEIARHWFKIRHHRLPSPKTGTFNGIEIVIDPRVTLEQQCFILLHLFGHSVQWTAPSLKKTVAGLSTASTPREFLRVLKRYEFAAAAYGKQILRNLDIVDKARANWFDDAVETDWQYVKKFYETGTIPSLDSVEAKARTHIMPKTIPPLKLHRVKVRYAF